jgi:hypothetical protein
MTAVTVFDKSKLPSRHATSGPIGRRTVPATSPWASGVRTSRRRWSAWSPPGNEAAPCNIALARRQRGRELNMSPSGYKQTWHGPASADSLNDCPGRCAEASPRGSGMPGRGSRLKRVYGAPQAPITRRLSRSFRLRSARPGGRDPRGSCRLRIDQG